MYLLNPLALWGLAAAAIPILMHLKRNQGARLVYFPYVRFLDEVRQQRFWSVELQEWLLLLLRLLLIALLVLAAAAPRWTPGASWFGGLLGGHGRPAAVGILLDCSASMDYRVLDTSVRRQALTRAETLMAGLPPGTTILTAAMGGPEGDRPPNATTRTGEAMTHLRNLPTGGDTPINEAVRGMLAALSPYGPSHLYIITDLQDSVWSAFAQGGEAEALRALMLEQQVRCTIIATPVAQPANLWIDEVGAPALPRPPWQSHAIPVQIAADSAVMEGTQPLRAEITVTDTAGLARQQTVMLQRQAEGFRGSVSIPIEARRDAAPDGPRERTIEVSLGEGHADPLPGDNQVHLRLPLAASAQVILVSPETPGLPARALSGALHAAQGTDESTLFSLATLERSALPQAELPRDAIMVLPADAGAAMDQAQAAAVVEAVRQGTGLLWIMGTASEDNMPEALASALGLGQLTSTQGRYGMRPAAPGHPLCQTLAGFPQAAWNAIRLARVVETTGAATTLYEAADIEGAALPVVMERPYGEGTVILVATGLEEQASSLAVAPQFVALVQESLIYLTTRQAGADHGPGSERMAAPPESRLALLTAPRQAQLQRAMGAELLVDQTGAPVGMGGRFTLWPEQLLLLLALACALMESYIANRL